MKLFICKNHFMPEHVTGYTEEVMVNQYYDGEIEVTWSHCGNSKGCFWTEPEDITSNYYGLGVFEILQSLKREGFSIKYQEKANEYR